jgi:anti-sigma-K factor RskA
MERDAIHDLTAAYALDALDPGDEREYEEHLSRCERCREELAAFQETAAALALAAPPASPPQALLERIVDQARREHANVVPLRPRRVWLAAAGAAAAVAAAAAIVLGLWAGSLSDSLDRERGLVALLSDPAARTVDLSGAEGRLVVARDGRAVLAVAGLGPAPQGKTYEAWVIEDSRPRRAGLFDPDDGRGLVELDEPVPDGAVVAVTLERRGGVDAPTMRPLLTAQA